MTGAKDHKSRSQSPSKTPSEGAAASPVAGAATLEKNADVPEYQGRIFSAVGRTTEAAIDLVLKRADPKAYHKKHPAKPKGEKKKKVPWDLTIEEEVKVEVGESHDGDGGESLSPTKRIDESHPGSPCFRSTSRDTGTVGEKSRYMLRRSFKEFNEEHDAPPGGWYNPAYATALPKNPTCDFHEVPLHESIKVKDELPEARLKEHPKFATDVQKTGPLLSMAIERPNLSLLSHRERHLKAMADTDECFTGWTPCEQDAVEFRFPAWDFNANIARASQAPKTFYVPGRYADREGFLVDNTKPSIKQGRRFLGTYKPNSPMKVAKPLIPDRSLSRIIPLLHKQSSTTTLWHRSRMSQRRELAPRTVYKEEDADKVLGHEMSFSRSRGEYMLRQSIPVSPRFVVLATRRTQSLGARIFQGDHAMRGKYGLKPDVSLEFQQLPVEQTAESWGVRAKIPCPDFKIGQGRDKTKRWSKTPQLKRSKGTVCPPFTRHGGKTNNCSLSAFAVDADVLHRMRRSRSYAEMPEWDATLREIEQEAG